MLVGLGEFIGAVTQMRTAPPQFNRDFLPIFSVMDYVPTRSYLCRTRGNLPDVGCDQDDYDRVEPSPHDRQIQHMRKRGT